MSSRNQNNQVINSSNRDYKDEINLLEIYEKYRFHWRWFVFSIILSVIIAIFYLGTTQEVFEVSSTIFIDDKETGGLSSERSTFDDFSLPEKPSITNEMEVLKSRSLIEKVIESLELNISYYDYRIFSNREIYKEQVPIKLEILKKHPSFYELDTTLSLVILSEDKFDLEDGDGDSVGKFQFGEIINTSFGDISFVNKNKSKNDIDKIIPIKINPLKSVAFKYREKLNIEPLGKKSSLVILTLKDVNKQKATDILDSLIVTYNQNALDYKRLVTNNTDKFINDRIQDISIELTSVDKGIEEFKIQNQFNDLNQESNLDMESNSEIERRIIDLSSQIRLVDYVVDHIKTNPGELVPDNIQLVDASNAENIKKYNNLLIEKNRIIKNSSKLNPAVINLESQILTLEEVITRSLNNLRSSLSFSLGEARNKEKILNTRKELAPSQERLFKDITRKQQIIESLYLYLLEKREENAIAFGIPVPNAKIVDKADGDINPVYPKTLIILGIALFAGLFIPVFVITIGSLFDNTVHSVEDVSQIVHAPIIGEIPKSKTIILDTEHGNSSLLESFRLLRTNLNFMVPHAKNGAKLIFLTSTIGGEGKTSISINLSSILALSDKKVLLIEADLRKPMIGEYLDLKMKNGLSHYLAGIDSNFDDMLIYNEKLNIDIIVSGEIAPNPSELIMNGRFKDLLVLARNKYDYVIVDTPPVSVVTDALLLNSFADLYIYIIRANYLDKRLLKKAQDIFEKKRLTNMAIVVNNSDFEKMGVGGSYGYYK